MSNPEIAPTELLAAYAILLRAAGRAEPDPEAYDLACLAEYQTTSPGDLGGLAGETAAVLQLEELEHGKAYPQKDAPK